MSKNKAKKEKKPKGKGGLKKVLLITLPIVMLLGGGVAAVFLGLVKIPGVRLPFGPKPAAVANKDPKKDKPKVATTKPVPKVTPPVQTPPAVSVRATPVPTTDPSVGVKKVAKLWNELEPDKLQLIIADWKDPDAATVLAKMDPERVADLLAMLPPKRASALSRAIQREASKLPKPENA